MSDEFSSHSPSLISPPANAAAITPDDATDLTATTRAIYVGGSGDMKVTTAGGNTVTFVGLVVGTILPIRATRVWDDSTDATNLVALW